MKILATALILLTLVANYSLAQVVQGVNCGVLGSGGATCSTQTTPTDMDDNNYTYTYNCQASGLRGIASKFIADSSTGTVCKVCTQIQKAGSPTMTITMQIYSDSSDNPGSMVTGGDFGSMSASSIVDGTFNCFTGGSASLTNGTAYWLVMGCSAYDGSNYLTWTQDDACATEHIKRWDGSAWQESSSVRCQMSQLFKN